MSGRRITFEELQRLLKRGCVSDEIHTEFREKERPYMTLMVKCPDLIEPIVCWAVGEDVAKIRQLMQQPRDRFKS